MIGFGFAVAFFVSLSVCGWIVRNHNASWLDQPDARSLHVVPVPRLGGVGLWGGVAVGLLVCWKDVADLLSLGWVVAALLLWLVGLVDDLRPLPPLMRLLVQFAAAVLFVFFSGEMLARGAWPLWIAGLGVLVVVWGVNLYNFMDGMDGLAAAMAIIGFSALGIMGLWGGQPVFAVICGIIVAASGGFLCLNYPPARLFMGDSGSTVLGYAMASLGIVGWHKGLFPLWAPLVIFSPFWVDASLTLLRRLARGEAVWKPHREHWYQRWALVGYSHRQVITAYCLLMLVCSGTVLAWQGFAHGYNEMALPAFWLMLYGIGGVLMERLLCGLQNKKL